MDENEETKVNENEAPAAEELEAIKAQLEEEQKAKAALEETMAGKDARIAELQGELSEAKQAIEEGTTKAEAATAEITSIREVKDQAVAKYLDMAKALNPTVPEGIIGGATIEEIEQSVEKAKAIVEAVRKTMEAEAAQTKVPAGAPTRGGISLEGLSAKEKIAAGIQQKGGTS